MCSTVAAALFYLESPSLAHAITVMIQSRTASRQRGLSALVRNMGVACCVIETKPPPGHIIVVRLIKGGPIVHSVAGGGSNIETVGISSI